MAKKLEQAGVRAAAMHGNKTQGARTKALADFKSGKLAALVATDIAARGIDIDSLPRVINFELPNVPEDYVHRIGRTGRAGVEGEALSLVSSEERIQWRDIERLIKRDVKEVIVPGFEPQQRNAVPRAAPHPAKSHAPKPGPRKSAGGTGRPAGARSGGPGRSEGARDGGRGGPRSGAPKEGGQHHTGQRHR
jgi:ATP-dependent RNA helicase RhlE